MKINVMGATGQLGYKVMHALIEQGAAESDLIASVRSPAKASPLAERGVQIRRDDLARATAAVCLNGGHLGRLYELTGPKALSMPELAGILTEVTEMPIKFASISDEEYARVCREGKEAVPDYLIGVLTSLYHAIDNGEFERVTDHVEQLTDSPPEDAKSYFNRVI